MANYFKKREVFLWSISVIIIFISFFLFDLKNYLTLTASLVGVTSLILNAKGNPTGQLLMVIFSVLYGIISFGFRYFGEMITYLGMTAPIAALALFSWLKNPYKGNKSEVRVHNINKNEVIVMSVFTIIVTVIFYFILKSFNTANLIFSTLSVATSFMASWLTFKRSEYFAVLYALNDVVLIILWVLASFENSAYISVVVCFVIFFINDLYGFYNWQKMKLRQRLN